MVRAAALGLWPAHVDAARHYFSPGLLAADIAAGRSRKALHPAGGALRPAALDAP